MISSYVLAGAIRKAIGIQAIVLALILMLGIAMYLFDQDLILPARLAALMMVLILLSATYSWLPGLKLQTGDGLRLVLLATLACILLGSMLLVSLLVFEIGPSGKWIIILVALQAVHLLLYVVNWFYLGERETAPDNNPKAMELASMNPATGSSLSPSRQGVAAKNHF